MMNTIRLVCRQSSSLALMLVVFPAMMVFLLWSSQVLTVHADGVHLFVEWPFVLAALVISGLFALLVPLQLYAVRLAAASATQAGGTLLGALLGMASMSCCTPVILPSILSLLGFSGLTILSVNVVVERYWLPLATVSVILLTYSLVSVVDSLQLECRVDVTAGVQGGARRRPGEQEPQSAE